MVSSMPIFEQKLALRTVQIEQFLDQLLSPSQTDKAKECPMRLKNAMRYGVLGGGKRFRPFLTLETAHMLGGNETSALRAGCALELIHCYSLIHDDLPAMDNDDLRRGQPTVHRAYDEATAILAGDALLTLAFEVIADPLTHPDPGIRAACTLTLAKAAGRQGMVGGQMLDLAAEGRFGDAIPDVDAIRTLQAMKTGALLTAAVELGAIIAGVRDDERKALVHYGQALGAAFQVADDILDREATTEVLGKRTGKDQEKGKGTLVDMLGISAAREECMTLKHAAFATLTPFKERAHTLQDAFIFAVQRKK